MVAPTLHTTTSKSSRSLRSKAFPQGLAGTNPALVGDLSWRNTFRAVVGEAMRVLVVDDADVADALCAALADRGHEAVAAVTERETLHRIGTFDPHAVVLDPRSVEIERAVLSLLRRRHVRLVGFCDWPPRPVEGETSALVLDAWVVKPGSLDDIEGALAGASEAARIERRRSV